MSTSKIKEDASKINGVFAEWDDPKAFRVYLISEDGESEPLRAAFMDESLHCRLFQACFLANPKDFAGQSVEDRLVGWSKEAPAKRAVKAVQKELKKIAKGEPGPTREQVSFAAQLALILKKPKG